jgi:hypothetical protein
LYYVQTIEISRHYGGPEEGGWWYDFSRVLYSTRLKKRAAKKLGKKLLREIPEQRYDRFSVLGDSDYFVYMGRTSYPVATERPRYC